MKSIAKFVAFCSKFSGNDRNYSEVIRLYQTPTIQVYTFSDGFFAVCMSIRHSGNEEHPAIILPLGCTTMLPEQYPDVQAAVGYDMTTWREATNEGNDKGQSIQKVLSFAKITESTSINPENLVISNEKVIPAGFMKAKPLAEVCKFGLLTYNGKKDDGLYMFSVISVGCHVSFCAVVTLPEDK